MAPRALVVMMRLRHHVLLLVLEVNGGPWTQSQAHGGVGFVGGQGSNVELWSRTGKTVYIHQIKSVFGISRDRIEFLSGFLLDGDLERPPQHH